MLSVLHQRNFALFWMGGLISQTGDWLLLIGLPVYVYLTTGSVLATSIMSMVGFLPGLLLGSVAGVFVDRWDRRLTLLGANLLLAAGLLPLFLVHDQTTLWLLYLVLFFEAVVSRFVLPAENALLPRLVAQEQLVSANALQAVSDNIARLVGAALGGVLLGLFGLRLTILADMLSFLFVAAMLWFIKVPPIEDRERLDASNRQLASSGLAAWREWLEGLRLIAGRPQLLVLFVIWAITHTGEGIFGVLLVVFVKQVLHSGAVVYGTLLGIQSIGTLLGALALGQFGQRWSPARLTWVGLCGFGLIDLLIIDMPLLVPGVWLVGALFILVGLPGALMSVGQQTLFQHLTEDRVRGRVYGALLAVGSATTFLGTILAGVFGDRLGPVPLLNLQGSAYFFAGLLALLTLGRLARRRQPHPSFHKTDASG